MNSSEQQLRMVVEKHKEHLKEIDVCISMCTELGMHLAESATQNNRLGEIENQIASYLKMEHDMQAHIATINEVILELQKNRDVDAVGEFKKRIATHTNNRPDLKSHPKMKSFLESTWKAAHPDEPFPGTGGEEDDEIQFLSQQGDLVDPITRQLYVKPVKNACGHTYSFDSIMEHIRKSRGRREVKCPVAGCGSTVSEGSLKRDMDMERKVKRHQLTQSQQESSDDVVDL